MAASSGCCSPPSPSAAWSHRCPTACRCSSPAGSARIEAYLPFHQTPRWWGFGGYLMVKTAGGPAALVGLIRNEVAALDPDQPMTLVQTLSEVVEARLSTYSALRGLLMIFSGLAGALAATRWLQSALYGVRASEPMTLLAVSVILVTVALTAAYLPARRATRVDPAMVLRNE